MTKMTKISTIPYSSGVVSFLYIVYFVQSCGDAGLPSPALPMMEYSSFLNLLLIYYLP